MSKPATYTLDDLPKDWRDFAIKESEAGANKVILLKYFKITLPVHIRFLSDYEEYREVMDWCEVLHNAWWLDLPRNNIENKGFNNTMWIIYAKNNLGYKDNPFSDPKKKGKSFEKKTKEQELINRFSLSTKEKSDVIDELN